MPFYVGKGTGNRYHDFKRRSQHVKSIMNAYQCHSEIIHGDLTEDDAFQKEMEIKNKYKNLGYPIVDAEVTTAYHAATRAGIERAKSEGKYTGRKKIILPDSFPDIYKSWKSGNITARYAMKELGL